MKREFKIILIGICMGIVLLVLQKAFQMDEAIFMRNYWILGFLVVLVIVLGNISYNMLYQKKMKEAAKLLEEQKPQEYLLEMERLLTTAKGENLRTVLTLNLSAAYIEMKQFDRAIAMLNELSDKHDKQLRVPAIKIVHQLNLCMSYFETKQYDKAMTLYEKNQTLFEKYRESKEYGANVAILDILVAIQNEEYEQAKRKLDKARKAYDNPRFQREFDEMERKLEEIC